MSPLLELRGVGMRFPRRSPLLRRRVGWIDAIDTVDVSLDRGDTLGLVGESGSGKSTLGRIALGLQRPSTGQVLVDGVDVTTATGAERKALRRQLQFVFQDPYSSFDPFTPIGESVVEPLRAHGIGDRAQRRARAAEVLEMVHLDPSVAARYPREFSGGQLQRIAVARALVLDPKLIVLDEPVSSLDVSTQAEVVNLLSDLQANTGIAFLFIAHDLAVVEHMSQRIAVMHLGQIVEQGMTDDVVRNPKHPYTLALLSAVPGRDEQALRDRPPIVLRGELPSPAAKPDGCHFHTRCPFAMDVCRDVDPPQLAAPDGTLVSCHLHTTGPQLGGTTVAQVPLPEAFLSTARVPAG